MSTGTQQEGRKKEKGQMKRGLRGSFLKHLTTNHYVVIAID